MEDKDALFSELGSRTSVIEPSGKSGLVCAESPNTGEGEERKDFLFALLSNESGRKEVPGQQE